MIQYRCYQRCGHCARSILAVNTLQRFSNYFVSFFEFHFHCKISCLKKNRNLRVYILDMALHLGAIERNQHRKSHKFNNNFQDTVGIICLINDKLEDAAHFLLKCHAYDDEWRDLLGTINDVFQRNILNLPN